MLLLKTLSCLRVISGSLLNWIKMRNIDSSLLGLKQTKHEPRCVHPTYVSNDTSVQLLWIKNLLLSYCESVDIRETYHYNALFWMICYNTFIYLVIRCKLCKIFFTKECLRSKNRRIAKVLRQLSNIIKKQHGPSALLAPIKIKQTKPALITTQGWIRSRCQLLTYRFCTCSFFIFSQFWSLIKTYAILYFVENGSLESYL